MSNSKNNRKARDGWEEGELTFTTTNPGHMIEDDGDQWVGNSSINIH